MFNLRYYRKLAYYSLIEKKTSHALDAHKTKPKSSWREWRHSDMCCTVVCEDVATGSALLTCLLCRSWQGLSLSISAIRAEMLALGFSHVICWFACMKESLCAHCIWAGLQAVQQSLVMSAAWHRNQVIICLVMVCLIWLAVSSSYFVAVECFYGNAGGLSPCAHTLPRDPELRLL